MPADMIAEARKDIAEIGAGLSGTEIAKLTAIITGGGFKRSNSKAAAEARFIKISTEAGIKNAADIVQGPYDMAEHVIREKLAGKALTIAEVKDAKPHHPAIKDIRFEPAKADDYPAPAAPKAKPAKRHADLPATHPANRGPSAGGKRAATLEAAQRGEIPDAPDFSAPTHARFRKKLGELTALIVAGDIAALKAFPINPVSSSPKAMAKYRDLAVIAIETRQKEAA